MCRDLKVVTNKVFKGDTAEVNIKYPTVITRRKTNIHQNYDVYFKMDDTSHL